MKKILALVSVALILAIGAVSATEDSEILQFAKGVLAGSIFTDNAVASIDGNTFIIKAQLNEYSDRKVGMIGFDLYNMASAAEKVIDQYPNRFSAAEAQLYNPSGNTMIGVMNIRVK